MATAKKAAKKVKPAASTKLRETNKGRGSIESIAKEVMAGLDSGKVKVAIVAYLDKDDGMRQFVSDGTASRTEIVGLATELQYALLAQKL